MLAGSVQVSTGTKHPVDFGEFRKGLRRGRPSRMEQRRAADQVITQIERKLAKTSYHELLERYGYGTLVVGMPLWFAVPPDDPFRAGGLLLYYTLGSDPALWPAGERF